MFHAKAFHIKNIHTMKLLSELPLPGSCDGAPASLHQLFTPFPAEVGPSNTR